MTNKDTPRHQNSLDNNLYSGFISKDPRGPEGPQATAETISNAYKILESENRDVFEIGEHLAHIHIK